MSYEIMYDRRFIRTSRGIIPMILSGSNNCIEQMWSSNGRTYERRERHWWAWVPRSLCVLDHTEAEYLKAIGDIANDVDPKRELFQWHGSWLTYGQWKRWFLNGCKTAATIEEYLSYNPSQSFSGYISIYSGNRLMLRKEELTENFNTTAELEDWLDRANAREQELRKEADVCNIYICLTFSGNEPLKVPAKHPVGEVVAKRGCSFVTDYEKDSCLFFSRDPAKAKVFPNVAEAMRELGGCSKEVRFVNAKKQIHAHNFTLKVLHGKLAGRFILRKTKGHLFPAYSVEEAKRFPSRDATISFARSVRNRGFHIGDSITVVNLEDGTEETVCITAEVM